MIVSFDIIKSIKINLIYLNLKLEKTIHFKTLNNMNKIEIPLSKTKILLGVIGSIAFVILGTIFLITPDTFITPILRNEQTIMIVGVAAVVFFGAVGVYTFKKLFDKTIGLTIDEKGITDNSNASSVGLIGWDEIVQIRTEEIMSNKFLLIFVSDPEKYIGRVSGIKRKLLQSSFKMYSTPISITSNTLKYNFNDLERLLRERLEEQRGRREGSKTNE